MAQPRTNNTPVWFSDLLRSHSPSAPPELVESFHKFLLAAGTLSVLKTVQHKVGPREGLLASEAQRFNQQKGRVGTTQLKIVKLNGTNAGNGGARARSWNPPPKQESF